MGLILCDPTVLSIRDLHLNSMSSIVVATYIYMQAVYINILVYTPQIHAYQSKLRAVARPRRRSALPEQTHSPLLPLWAALISASRTFCASLLHS